MVSLPSMLSCHLLCHLTKGKKLTTIVINGKEEGWVSSYGEKGGLENTRVGNWVVGLGGLDNKWEGNKGLF